MGVDLFKDVKFYIIKCDDKQIIDQLKSWGAVNHPLLSESVRFAISDDSSSVEVDEAEDLYAVHVVTSKWVKLSAEAGQFLPFKPFHPQFKPLFANLVFCLSELSVKDRLTLWAYLTIHGATVQHVLDHSVTHVVSGRAAGELYAACTKGLPDFNPILVTPDWIVDCLARKELLPCDTYHPDLLKRPASPAPPTVTSFQPKSQQSKPTPAPMELTSTEPTKSVNSEQVSKPKDATGTAPTPVQLAPRSTPTHLPVPGTVVHAQQPNAQSHPTTTVPGTNLQAATGISVQQICMNAGEHPYLGTDKPGRGAHSRGAAAAAGSGSGRGQAARRAQQERLHHQVQQQHQHHQQQQQQQLQHHQRFPTVNQPRYVPSSPQRFPLNRPNISVAQRFPVNIPGVMDVQAGINSVGMLTIPGSGMIASADGFQLINPAGASTGSHPSMLLSPGQSMTLVQSSSLGASVITTTATSAGSGTGHHGSKTKSKSSKHAQEQNLNEEEKDAIVMQNVKNILSLQHTWNRESSHGRSGGGSSVTTSSTDGGSSSVVSCAGCTVSSHTGAQSNIGTYTLAGVFGSSSGATPNQLGNLHNQVNTSGSTGIVSAPGTAGAGGGHTPTVQRKPKSPKSPARAGLNPQLSGSTALKASPKSPKGIGASGAGRSGTMTKVLSSPQLQQPQSLQPQPPSQQQQQQLQQQQQPSIVMAGGSNMPSVLLTSNHLSQVQCRQPGTTNPIIQGSQSLQRPPSVQHFLATNNLGPQQQQQQQQQPNIVSAAPAYIVQRHPSGQLLASVARQASRPAQPNSQPTSAAAAASMVHGHYQQRPGGMLASVASGLPPSSLTVQQQQQQQQQQQAQANQRAFQQAQLQQPTLFVRTARHHPYQVEVSEVVQDVSMTMGDSNDMVAPVLVTTGPTSQMNPGQSQPSGYAQQIQASQQQQQQQQVLLQPAGNHLVHVKSSHSGPQHHLMEHGNPPGMGVQQAGGRGQPQTVSAQQHPQTGPPQATMHFPVHQQLHPNKPSHPSSGVDRLSPAQSAVRQPYIQAQQQQPTPQQHQQQKVQLSMGAPHYQQVQGYAPSQQPQQIILQSPTGQQLIAHPQPMATGVARGAMLQPGIASGSMLLRSVGPHAGPVNTAAAMQQSNQSHVVSVPPSGPQSVSAIPTHIMNGVAGNNIVFQTNAMPPGQQTPPQQQLLHTQPGQTYSPQHHKVAMPPGQPLKPAGMAVPQQQTMIRANHGPASANLFGNAGTSGPYQQAGLTNGLPQSNTMSQQNQAQLMRPCVPPGSVHVAHAAPGQPHHLRPNQQQPPAVTPSHPVPAAAAAAAQISSDTPARPNPANAVVVGGSVPGLGPITTTYYGHEGAPKPSRPEECLIGCVFLLLGYRSAGEAQRASWRRIIRSYGAQVVLTYDPTRVTHLVIDCQLEEPDVVKQALRDRVRLVTIFWVNDVLAKGRMVPPYEILHLPSPFSPDITFSFIRAQIISLTGFEGKERLKVETMIRQLGASFTDYLEPSNTLLVCKQPEGKKYEMAQLWEIPCVNLRWLQDLYFGDLMSLASDLPHKYLSFEPADVTTALDRCTPRVQDLMIGWQTPIRLNQEIWLRFNKLAGEFADEERERKRKLELDASAHPKAKKTKCPLVPLTEDQINLALSCKTRQETLEIEAREKLELQQHLLRNRIQQQQQQEQQTSVTECESQPAHLTQLEALITDGLIQDSFRSREVPPGTAGPDDETRQSCTSTLSNMSQELPTDTPIVPIGANGDVARVNTTDPEDVNQPNDENLITMTPVRQAELPECNGAPMETVLNEPELPSTSCSQDVEADVHTECKQSGSPQQQVDSTGVDSISNVQICESVETPTPTTTTTTTEYALNTDISMKPEEQDGESCSAQSSTCVPQHLVQSTVRSSDFPTMKQDQQDNERSSLELKRPASVPYSIDSERPVPPVRRKRCASGSSLPIVSKRPAICTVFELGSGDGEAVRSDSSVIESTTQPCPPLVHEERASMATSSDPDDPASLTKVKQQQQQPEEEQARPDVTVSSTELRVEPDKPMPVDPTVRITFTAIDYDSRLSLIDLCQQLPNCEIVERAQEATHLVCSRLLRTPKTYLAVALGRYLVTPKWIQASVLRGCWLDETPWLLSDPDAEAQLGVRLQESIRRARRRQMLGPEASLFAGLEFWLSPRACHREMCIELIKVCGGVVRLKRPTQKMALLPQPKQLIICHEDDSHVASYLMRIKTGNKAVHHEEFILSGALRQELDFDAYQIQYVTTLQTGLKAAVAAAEAALANSGSYPMTTVLPAPTSLRFGTAQSDAISTTAVMAPRRSSHPKPEANIQKPSVLNSSVCLSVPCSVSQPGSICVSQTPTSAGTEPTVSSSSTWVTRPDNASPAPAAVRIHSYSPSTHTTESHCTLRLSPNSYHQATPMISTEFRGQEPTTCHISEAVHHSVPSTGLQHLLADSLNDPNVSVYHVPVGGYPTARGEQRGPSNVRFSLAMEHSTSPMLIAYSGAGPLNTATTRIVHTTSPMVCTGFVASCSYPLTSSSQGHNVSDSVRFGVELPSEARKAVPRPRPSTLLLSGAATSNPPLTEMTSTGSVQTVPRPVTALTAMIVAAESSNNDLVPALPLGETDVVMMCPVSSFVLPKPTNYRSHSSSADGPPTNTATGGLNARSAAADAHAVATATAAAANALNSAEGKGIGAMKAGGPLPVPSLRSPRVYSSDVAEVRKRIASGSGPSTVGTSVPPLSAIAPLDDTVKSLISNQFTFQQPLQTVNVRYTSALDSSCMQLISSDAGPARSFSASDIPTCLSMDDVVSQPSVQHNIDPTCVSSSVAGCISPTGHGEVSAASFYPNATAPVGTFSSTMGTSVPNFDPVESNTDYVSSSVGVSIPYASGPTNTDKLPSSSSTESCWSTPVTSQPSVCATAVDSLTIPTPDVVPGTTAN